MESTACLGSEKLRDGCRSENFEAAFTAARLGSGLCRVHLAMVKRQNSRLVVIDRPRILLDVAGIVDTARKLSKLPPFDCLERANADLGRFSNLLQGNAAISPDRGQFENVFLVCHQIPSSG